MPITKLPGVYYNEKVTYELTGEGSKIPVVIGVTGNTGSENYKVDGTVMRKFTSWEDVNRAIDAETPGIGVWTENTTNQLSKFLQEFFEESKLQVNSDIGVPYVYVIDVGDGKTKQAWLNALDLAKTKLDATIEVYVGADAIQSYDLKAFLDGAYEGVMGSRGIKPETQDLDLRCAFTTKGY